MSARVSRMATLLELFVQHGELKADDLAAHTQWPLKEAHKALANARSLGYLDFTGTKVGNQQRALVLNDLGRFRAGLTTVDPRVDVRATAVADAQTDALTERAAALILAAQGGLDSDQLADKLGVTSLAVEVAMAGYSGKRRFVTCKVWRGGDEFIQYRESASAAMRADHEWQKLGANAPAPRPVAANSRYLGTTPAGIPVVEIDIDAIHRKQRTAAAPAEPAVDLETVTESSGGEVEDPGCEPYFCLYSTGDLLVQRDNGQQVQFTPDETRALFQWLDRLGGTALVRLAAPDEEVPA